MHAGEYSGDTEDKASANPFIERMTPTKTPQRHLNYAERIRDQV